MFRDEVFFVLELLVTVESATHWQRDWLALRRAARCEERPNGTVGNQVQRIFDHCTSIALHKHRVIAHVLVLLLATTPFVADWTASTLHRQEVVVSQHAIAKEKILIISDGFESTARRGFAAVVAADAGKVIAQHVPRYFGNHTIEDEFQGRVIKVARDGRIVRGARHLRAFDLLDQALVPHLDVGGDVSRRRHLEKDVLRVLVLI